MNTAAKVFVVLLLVVALGTVFLAYKNIALSLVHKELAIQYKAQIEKQKEAIGSLKTVINSGNEKMTALRAQRQQLTEELAKTKTAKQEVEGKLAQSQIENNRLNEELTGAKGKITTLEEQNKTNEGKISELTQERDKLNVELANYKQKSNELAKRVVEIKSVISANPELWALMCAPDRADIKIVKKDETPVAGAPKQQKPVEVIDHGEVVAVKDLGVTALMFDGNVRVKKGDAFASVRDGQVKGDMMLGDVYRTLLICQRKDQAVESGVKKGDRVTLRKW